MREKIARAFLAGLQGNVALVEQPGIQIKRAIVGREAVVGEHHQRAFGAKPRERPAKRFVHFRVELLDHSPEFVTGLRGVAGMVRIHGPPEHVRVEINAREIKKEKPAAIARQLAVEGAQMLGEHEPRLLKIVLVRKDAGRQRLGVLRDALRVERAELVVEFARVARRGGDRQRGIGGVHIHRGHVQLQPGVRLAQMEAADPLDACEMRHQVEGHRHPAAPFPFREKEFASAD